MSVEYKDYYKLLGVARTAAKEEIGKAFKKLARKYHPDLNQGDKDAEAKFKDINEAYEVLKDEEKRKLYDQLGPNWQHGQNFQQPPGFENYRFFSGAGRPDGDFGSGGFTGSGFSDFFETLFGGGGRGQSFGPDPFGGFRAKTRNGQDMESGLALTLNEACKGGPKTVSVNGQGGAKSLEVNIPAGVKEGARIRLAGQGAPAPGGPGTGNPGDLYLRIRLLPHSDFTLDGSDIIYDLNLAPWEAALGVKARIPTLEKEVELTIPAGTGSGRKFRLRGKGMGSVTNKGDQYVRVNIRVPEHLAPEEKELWEKLAEISQFKARAD